MEARKSKVISTGSLPIPHPPSGQMNTSPAPKGKGASVPGWGQAAKAKSGLLKAKKR